MKFPIKSFWGHTIKFRLKLSHKWSNHRFPIPVSPITFYSFQQWDFELDGFKMEYHVVRQWWIVWNPPETHRKPTGNPPETRRGRFLVNRQNNWWSKSSLSYIQSNLLELPVILSIYWKSSKNPPQQVLWGFRTIHHWRTPGYELFWWWLLFVQVQAWISCS